MTMLEIQTLIGAQNEHQSKAAKPFSGPSKKGGNYYMPYRMFIWKIGSLLLDASRGAISFFSGEGIRTTAVDIYIY